MFVSIKHIDTGGIMIFKYVMPILFLKILKEIRIPDHLT